MVRLDCRKVAMIWDVEFSYILNDPRKRRLPRSYIYISHGGEVLDKDGRVSLYFLTISPDRRTNQITRQGNELTAF